MDMEAGVVAFVNFFEADEGGSNVAAAIGENFYRDVALVEVVENFFNGKFFFGRGRRNKNVDRAGNVQQKIFEFGGKFGIKNVNDRSDFKIDGRRVEIQRNFQRKIFFALEPHKIFHALDLHKKNIAAISALSFEAQVVVNEFVNFGAVNRAKIFERVHEISADKTSDLAIKIHKPRPS